MYSSLPILRVTKIPYWKICVMILWVYVWYRWTNVSQLALKVLCHANSFIVFKQYMFLTWQMNVRARIAKQITWEMKIRWVLKALEFKWCSSFCGQSLRLPTFFQRSTSDVGLWAGSTVRQGFLQHPSDPAVICLYVLKMAGNKSYTIVEYFGGDDGYRCGYCKNEKGNFSHGKCLGKQAETGLTLPVFVNWFRLTT